MPTFKQIEVNQRQYKDEILAYFREEIKKSKLELESISTTDEFIAKEKEKLLKKFRKTNTLDSIKRYFLMSSNRDKTYYVWWDAILQEAIILRYDKS